MVDEDCVRAQARHIKSNLTEMDEVVDAYIVCLDEMLARVVKSGQTADALSAYRGFADQLKGNLAQIGEAVNTLAEEYLGDIDEADSYIF